MFGRRHEVWDVHTDHERWWVVTAPMNLYPQRLFPSPDCTLTFHIGLMARVEARQRGPGPGTGRDKLVAAWRPWMQAADALDLADEAEAFQAVGMRCRECLLQLAYALADDGMVANGEAVPKRSDFIHWTEYIAGAVARGSSAAEVRGYLKAVARSAWQLVGWLTHASNANHHDAQLALSATEAVLTAFGAAVLRRDLGGRDRCPRCRSYCLTSEGEANGSASILCETCGYKTS